MASAGDRAASVAAVNSVLLPMLALGCCEVKASALA
jgi:hypothetical protein